MYHKKDDSVLNHFKNFSLESPIMIIAGKTDIVNFVIAEISTQLITNRLYYILMDKQKVGVISEWQAKDTFLSFS